MKTRIVFIILIILISLTTIKAFSAEKVYMPFFEMINVHSDYQYSVARMLKNYIDEQKKYTVIIPQRSDSLIKQSSNEQIRALASSLDCGYYIVGDMNRLGETVIISIALYKTSDASMIWNDRLKANTPDDIDPILQKIARSIGTQDKAAAEGDIYNVTNYDMNPLKQIQANYSWGASVGGAQFFSSPFSTDGFAAGFGVFGYYDAREFIFDITGQIYGVGSSKSYLYQASLNVYRPFSPASNTAFFGGGFGLGGATYNSSDYGNDNKGSGLVLNIGGGYIIGRTSSVALRIHANYFIGLFKIKNYNTSPHGLMLNMELYFAK
jgi:hypothetical protein